MAPEEGTKVPTLNEAVDLPVPEGRHVLHVLDRTGDTRTVWDPTNDADVELAKSQFEQARGKGMTAYAVTKEGGKGEVVREWDPTAEKLIFAPANQGG
jgi:hypothetical protein